MQQLTARTTPAAAYLPASITFVELLLVSAFYRATHYSAKRGLALLLSVRLSVALVDHDHIG